MRTSDIVKQLQAVLPTITDSFTKSRAITSITEDTGVLTIKPLINGMKVGSKITIRGIRLQKTITNFSIDGDNATLTTEKKHQLTYGYNENKVLLYTGTEEVEFDLIEVIDDKNFIVNKNGVSDFSGYSLIENAQGVNSRQLAITEVGVDFFKVNVNRTLTYNSFNLTNAYIEYGYNITGIANEDEINRYIDTNTNDDGEIVKDLEPELFIALRENVTSQSQDTFDDAVNKIIAGQKTSLEKIKTIAVVLTYPIYNKRAFEGVVFAEELEQHLDKCLFGLNPPNYTTDKTKYLVVPISNSPVLNEDGSNAIYQHEFIYQRVYRLQNDSENGDGVDSETFAFRDFEVQYKLEGDDYTDVKKTDTGKIS